MMASRLRGTWANGIAALACALALAHCGGSSSSPTAPSTTLALNGTWTGSFSYTTGGVTLSEDVTLTLLQPNQTASGTWAASSLATGAMSFVPAASLSGSFTISQPNVGSTTPCTGSSTISGTASASDLVLSVASITPTATCPWATGMRFTLRK